MESLHWSLQKGRRTTKEKEVSKQKRENNTFKTKKKMKKGRLKYIDNMDD